MGQREKSNKISAESLKTAGYLDTKDQDKINYIFVPPKKEPANNIPEDAAQFIRTDFDSTSFKKENLASKVREKKTTGRTPYIPIKKETVDLPKYNETTEILKVLDDITTLEPGKNAQLAARKISEKYKKITETMTKKNRYKLPAEIVEIVTIETPQRQVKVPVSIEKSKRSGNKAAKNIIKKCDKIRREETFKKIVDEQKTKKEKKH